MKALILAAALALSGPVGCATVPNPLQATANDERALYAAEAAYFGALTAINVAIDNGHIEPGSDEALRALDSIERAHGFLVLTRQAYEAGNASDGYSMALQTLAMIAEIQRAINER